MFSLPLSPPDASVDKNMRIAVLITLMPLNNADNKY
jgi:hypothetical protein